MSYPEREQARGVIFNYTAKVRQRHCGLRIKGQLFSNFFHFFFFAVILVIWSFGQNRFRVCKKCHYNNIYIYYYSELEVELKNHFDHFDLDHFDHMSRLL